MQTISVLPNPWAAVDAFGVPCAVCPRDPDADAGGPGQYVGAKVDPKRTLVLQKLEKGDDLRSPRQKTVFSYLGKPADDPELRAHLLSREPIKIPATTYYRQRIAEGVLVCADAESAKVARFKNFVPLDHAFPLPPEPVAPNAPAEQPEEAKAEAPSAATEEQTSDAPTAEAASESSTPDTSGETTTTRKRKN
jgi:hypothetical protein